MADSLLATSSQAAFWATYMLWAVVATGSDEIPRGNLESEFTFCMIIGGGQVGFMTAGQLLDLGWPSGFIEVVVNDESQHHVQGMRDRGLRCVSFKEAYKERLAQAIVVILAIRPSNLEQFARTAASHMRKDALLVSCLSAVPAEKIRVCLDSKFVIRTIVVPVCLPFATCIDSTRTTKQKISSALSHAIVGAEDVDTILSVLGDLFKKRCMGGGIIPKGINSACDFMTCVVETLLSNVEHLFSHSLPSLMREGPNSCIQDSRLDEHGAG